jgi:hypothetical protein
MSRRSFLRRKPRVSIALVLIAVAVAAATGFAGARAGGSAPSGAIFTTLPDGSEVNFNIYSSKELVYLDGGPGPGAPQTAAGLDDGIYVFQVTDPSGKTLLSTDPAGCRRFTVSGGIITAVVPAGGCEHPTGLDVDHGAATVKLMPYLDTPNNGGVYKAWATTQTNYLAGCAALGQANGLSLVDCGYKAGVAVHGFIPDASKTDNFKVKEVVAQEIDARFFNYAKSGDPIDGLKVTWTDPVGASNQKWSYNAPSLQVYHEAHVEAVTAGTHSIRIDDQPGCTVDSVYYDGSVVAHGPATVAVKVAATQRAFSIPIVVSCH